MDEITNRYHIRVSAMSLDKQEFTDKLKKVIEVITNDNLEVCLMVLEDHKQNGAPVHLHSHIYIETNYAQASIRKFFKDEFNTEEFRATKKKGHKPIVVQIAREIRLQNYKYLLKCNPPQIIFSHNVKEETIKDLTGQWVDKDDSSNSVKKMYLEYMTQVAETELAQLSSEKLPKKTLLEKQTRIIVTHTVEFFANVLEKPFAMSLLTMYVRFYLVREVPVYKDKLIDNICENFDHFKYLTEEECENIL